MSGNKVLGAIERRLVFAHEKRRLKEMLYMLDAGGILFPNRSRNLFLMDLNTWRNLQVLNMMVTRGGVTTTEKNR